MSAEVCLTRPALQCFEFTDEPAFRMLKRQLERMSADPASIDTMAYMDIVRSGAEAGLVADVARFRDYREKRTTTSNRELAPMKSRDIRWEQRLINYSTALAQLTKAVVLAGQRPLSDLEQQGLIQAFEFTHELAWNVMKDYFCPNFMKIAPIVRVLTPPYCHIVSEVSSGQSPGS